MQLAGCVVTGGVLWLVVLPWIGRAPRVRAAIERNESLEIDPSAKFYSELPAMPGIVRRVEATRW
jgi:hypothetical protein